MKDCIFCKIAEEKNITEDYIYENNNFFSVFDISPQIQGHALVISKKHFPTILEIPLEESKELLDCIQKTSKILCEKFGIKDFNVVTNSGKHAGQIIHHVHFHILPRKERDNFQIFKK